MRSTCEVVEAAKLKEKELLEAIEASKTTNVLATLTD